MAPTDNPAIYQKATALGRNVIAAAALANNPELADPEGTGVPTPAVLARREIDAEIVYYEFLAAHRTELERHPEFSVEYGVLDDLAAEHRSLTEVFTDTGDPEDHDHDRRRSR